MLFSVEDRCRRNAPGHVVDVERINCRSAVRAELEDESVERVGVTVGRFQHGHLGTRRQVLIQAHRVGPSLAQHTDERQLKV